MKKKIRFAAALCAAVLLSACSAAPSDAAQTAESAKEMDAEPAAAYIAEPLYKVSDSDESDFYFPQADDGGRGASRMVRVSYADQSMQPLCSIAGCTHTDDTCPAVRLCSEYGAVYVLDDAHLLLVHTDYDTDAGALYRTDRSGENLETITLDAPELNNMVGSFYTDGHELFALVYDGNAENYSVRAYDLQTGAARTAGTTVSSSFSYGAFGRDILLRQQVTDANGSAVRADYVLFDVDTGEQTTLRSYPRYAESREGRDYDYTAALIDGQFYEYCYTDRTLTVTDLATNETRTLAAQLPADPNNGRGAFYADICRVLDGYLVLNYWSNDWTTEAQNPTAEVYFINLQTGEVREQPALPTQDWNGYGHSPIIYAQNADWLLMCCRTEPYSTTDIGAEGVAYTVQSEHYYLGMLSHADYLNGTPNYIELGRYD